MHGITLHERELHFTPEFAGKMEPLVPCPSRVDKRQPYHRSQKRLPQNTALHAQSILNEQGSAQQNPIMANRQLRQQGMYYYKQKTMLLIVQVEQQLVVSPVSVGIL